TILSTSKPLFGLVYKIFIYEIFPLAILFYTGHLFLYGPRILELLDSPCLRGPYEGKAKAYFTYLQAGNILLFAVVNAGNVLVMVDHPEWHLLYEVFALVNMFLFSTTRYFCLVVVQYVQHSTVVSLKVIKLY